LDRLCYASGRLTSHALIDQKDTQWRPTFSGQCVYAAEPGVSLPVRGVREKPQGRMNTSRVTEKGRWALHWDGVVEIVDRPESLLFEMAIQCKFVVSSTSPQSKVGYFANPLVKSPIMFGNKDLVLRVKSELHPSPSGARLRVSICGCRKVGVVCCSLHTLARTDVPPVFNVAATTGYGFALYLFFK
jgi:hypothetical protein